MPTKEDIRLLWLVSIAMYVFGGLTLLAVLAAPDPDPSDHTGLLVMAGVYLLSGAVLWRAGPRRGLVRAAPLWGILAISATVAVAQPIGATSFFYLWPLLGTAYFLTRREGLIALALAWSTFAVALLGWSPPGLRLAMFMATAVSTSVVAVVMRLLRERHDRLLAELHRSAETDPLTGLLNRRAFDAALARELSRARRTGLPMTLAVFDLDYFKQVNDRFGHAVGDEVLVRFGELLARGARQIDVVARVGGEEFAVILPGTAPQGALRYATRMVVGLRAEPLEDGSSLSASAGLAGYGGRLDTSDALLLAADRALYEAKAAGRGRVAVHGGRVSVALGAVASDGSGALERAADLVDRHDAPQPALGVDGEQRADSA